MKTKLFKYQKFAVDFIKDKKHCGILMDYGTGKTRVLLEYINIHSIKKILVIAPKSVIQETWPQEIKKHSNFKFKIIDSSYTESKLISTLERKYKIISFKPLKKVYSNKSYIYLINYDIIVKYIDILLTAGFDLVVADESTLIKNHTAKRSVAVTRLSAVIPRAIIMTGYPVTESIQDLYNQFYFMDRGETFGKSFFSFYKKYFTRMKPYKNIFKKEKIKEIKKLINKTCILMKKEDCMDLPPRQYIKRPIAPNDYQKELLIELKDNFFLALEQGKITYSTKYVLPILVKMHQICSGFFIGKNKKIAVFDTPKHNYLFDMVESILPNRIIIWCKFTQELRNLEKLLKKYKPAVLYSNGPDNKELIQDFRKNKRNIIIATPKYLGSGITLTEANYGIYYSNDYSYEKRMNSEARIYREGSQIHKNITYIDMYLNGTIEQRILDILKKKKDVLSVLKDVITK